MKFSEIVDQASEFLRHRERVSYRVLKREFDLDDESLEDLKIELIDAQRIAVDEAGKVLVWVGTALEGETAKRGNSEAEVVSSQLSVFSPQPPVTYTPRHLAERIRAEQVALEARGAVDGERKTITALFADLKGSTALIEGLDPEEARAIIDPALQLMMDAVHRYEGYVAQALGDGIFALFGAPLAHEDHPQRALYAALRMQEEMRRYADTLRQKGYPPLLMRVGVNTGEVVVRSIRKDDLHTDYVPVGHSTNLAARMEQLAVPGSVLISAYTHRLTDGYFAFKDLGPTQIKGVEESLNIYEVLGVGPLRTRLQVAARRGLTRFVGRQREMEQMRGALDGAKAGHGQIVGVMGEPGLGKSRLFYEFKLLSQAGCLILEAYSVSHGKASPYLPVIELLKSYFDIKAEDDERRRREKVGGKVLMLDRSLEDTLPYLLALLGIEEQPLPLQQMDAQIRRRRTFEALKKLFLRESLNQPLILIFEDLHWIDSETQGFLDTLSEGMASAKSLLLVNYRPEYRHEWGQKTYYTQLRLVPFGKAEAEEFLTVLLGEQEFPRGERDRERVSDSPLQTLKQMILEKTEGTPFFMEEVVQELREQGILSRAGVETRHVASLPSYLHLPPTVQGVLAARIDRLALDEKALLQQLAVIGREFPLGLVRRVVLQPEEELYRLLSSLQRKEFLYEQPAFPEVEYIFKHALTQEVAYTSVLIERRKVLHEQTAQAIETSYHDRLEEHYSELAHHYSRSNTTAKAVEYLSLAGQQAVQRSANVEAIGHLTRGVELLEALPDSPARTQQELTLQVWLGSALLATRGHAALEVERTYIRARELCLQVDDLPQLARILSGLWVCYHVRAELRTACELGEQLLTLAQRVQDPVLLTEAHKALGASLGFRGEMILGRAHLEQAVAIEHVQSQPSLALFYGDPRVESLSHLARVLWVLGYPEQARRRSYEAITLARELSHPGSLAMALVFAAWVHEFCREGEIVREQAEAIVNLATEHELLFYVAWGIILRGEALAVQGQRTEGMTHMREGWTALRDSGTRLNRAYSLGLLAEAYGKAGQIEEGFAQLREAFKVIDESGGRWWEAELYRLKGELTLQQASQKAKVGAGRKASQKSKGKRQKAKIEPSPQSLTSSTQEAEECFLKAIEISRKQQAKSLELRATMSLTRLWQQQGKRFEAHQMLSEVYHWFTEGFDTKDLQEAKRLIEELASVI